MINLHYLILPGVDAEVKMVVAKDSIRIFTTPYYKNGHWMNGKIINQQIETLQQELDSQYIPLTFF